MRRATIKDVAALAGVSVATASRVLTGNRATSEVSRTAVRDAAEALGYVADARASALRSSRSGVVGLLIADVRNPFFAELAHTVQGGLARAGLTTLLGSSAESATLQEDYLRALVGQRIDGLVAAPVAGASPGLARLEELGVPVVFVDRAPEMTTAPRVLSDPVPGIRAVLEALVSQGHRRIGFVAGPANSVTGPQRLLAFRQVAADLGDGDVLIATDRPGDPDPAAAVDTLLAVGVTAVVLGYSPHAVAAISHLRGRGVEPGRDVAVVSFDNLPVFELMTPQVAVITQHVNRLGEEAVRLLLASLVGEPAEDVTVGTDLVTRPSLCPSPPGAPSGAVPAVPVIPSQEKKK